MHNQITRRLAIATVAATGLLVAGVVGLSVTPTSALATTTVNLYTAPSGVTSGSYPGVCTQATPCSLELALIQVNSGTALKGDAVVINLATGTYPDGGYSIEPNTAASPASVELLGAGSDPSQTVLTGGGTVRTLAVGGVDYGVTIEDLELADGNSGSGYGGNLLADAVSGGAGVVLDDDIVTGGQSAPGGQADVESGGLTVRNTTVENSQGDTDGTEALGDSNASLGIYDSTYSGNAGNGVHLANASTFGTLAIDSSTFVDNDGGVANESTSNLTISHSTFTGNFAGILVNGPVSVADSIIVANQGRDCFEFTPEDAGNNVVDDSSCGFGTQHGSRLFTTSQIGLLGLASNGGPTETERILTSSVADNFIPVSTGGCFGTDQRGIPFLQGSGDACDAGAYQYAPPTVTAVSPSSAAPGASLQLTGNNLLYATAAIGASTNVSVAVTNPSLTSLSFVVPTLAPGSEPITVSNADGSVTVPFTVPGADSTGGSTNVPSSSTTTSIKSNTPATSTTTPTVTTNTTPVVPAKVLVPVITLGSANLKFKHARAPLKLTCATAACSGVVEVTEAKLVKLKHGHRQDTVVLARGSYRLSPGATGTVTLTLTGAGKRQPRLARAAGPADHGTVTVTLLGGRSVTAKISLS